MHWALPRKKQKKGKENEKKKKKKKKKEIVRNFVTQHLYLSPSYKVKKEKIINEKEG